MTLAFTQWQSVNFVGKISCCNVRRLELLARERERMKDVTKGKGLLPVYRFYEEVHPGSPRISLRRLRKEKA